MEPTEAYFLADITGGAHTLTKGGSPQVEISMLLTARADKGKWIDLPSPQSAKMWLSLQGGAEPITFTMLEQLGFNGDFTGMGFANGAHVRIESYMSEYNGNTTRKYRLSRPDGAGQAKPAPAALSQEAGERWLETHGGAPLGVPAAHPAGRPAKSATPAPAATEPEPPPSGDDIPF